MHCYIISKGKYEIEHIFLEQQKMRLLKKLDQ
ncbi:hypothetical protein [uncultured Gammaproteobacteria bacterium]|nr:hypothetical protein [uncultured Gammaproteobacteria bacterium]